YPLSYRRADRDDTRRGTTGVPGPPEPRPHGSRRMPFRLLTMRSARHTCRQPLSPVQEPVFREEIMSRAAVVAAACALLIAMVLPAAASAQGPAGAGLSKEDRARLIDLKEKGTNSAIVLIASKTGANRTVADGIRKLGGTIQYRDDNLDYLRAKVATSKVDAVAALT